MKKRHHTFFLSHLFVFIGFFILPTLAGAHDLWINLDQHYLKPGGKTAVKAVFGHNFPYYDILITKNKMTDFSYRLPDGRMKSVENIREERKGEKFQGALVGDISVDQEGTYLVTASRKTKGDREHVTSEKYAKAVIVANKGSEVISKPFGHRIEIIPLKNPSEVKPGEVIPVKIFFEGKPLSTFVYATYAGYFSEDEPFPVSAKADDEGIAYVKISRPGIWMVVANFKVDFSASLTFEIK